MGEAYESADLALLEACPGVELRRGFVPEGDLDLWSAAADVLVLPYAVGSHSGVLHRGLAAGTPVLASPPLAEEVHRTGAGAVVPLDPAAWAEALVRALGTDPPCPAHRPDGPWHRPGHLGGLPPESWTADAGRGMMWPRWAGIRDMRGGFRQARALAGRYRAVPNKTKLLGMVRRSRLRVGALVAAASTGHVLYPAWLAVASRRHAPNRWFGSLPVARSHCARRRLRRSRMHRAQGA